MGKTGTMLARVSGAYLFGQQKHGPSNTLVKSRVPSQGGFPLERNSWSHEGFVTIFAGSHYWITALLLSTAAAAAEVRRVRR